MSKRNFENYWWFMEEVRLRNAERDNGDALWGFMQECDHLVDATPYPFFAVILGEYDEDRRRVMETQAEKQFLGRFIHNCVEVSRRAPDRGLYLTLEDDEDLPVRLKCLYDEISFLSLRETLTESGMANAREYAKTFCQERHLYIRSLGGVMDVNKICGIIMDYQRRGVKKVFLNDVVLGVGEETIVEQIRRLNQIAKDLGIALIVSAHKYLVASPENFGIVRDNCDHAYLLIDDPQEVPHEEATTFVQFYVKGELNFMTLLVAADWETERVFFLRK